MSDKETTPKPDVTAAWQASENQKASAKKLRLFAALSWVVAIGTEIFGIIMLLKGKFDQGNLALLIGILIVIAVFAIAGSILWKKANRHDPASKEQAFKFFIQNQLGAIITVIAFLPLLALIFLDKDMDPKNKKIAGAVAAQIKAGEPTKSCSPAVAEQAQQIADDTAAVAEATKSAENPNGLDVVYWIAPKDGAEKSSNKLVFHLCENVSTLRGKIVNSGSVTEAYNQNAVRLTKQLKSEQRQCGLIPAE